MLQGTVMDIQLTSIIYCTKRNRDELRETDHHSCWIIHLLILVSRLPLKDPVDPALPIPPLPRAPFFPPAPRPLPPVGPPFRPPMFFFIFFFPPPSSSSPISCRCCCRDDAVVFTSVAYVLGEKKHESSQRRSAIRATNKPH